MVWRSGLTALFAALLFVTAHVRNVNADEHMAFDASPFSNESGVELPPLETADDIRQFTPSTERAKSQFEPSEFVRLPNPHIELNDEEIATTVDNEMQRLPPLELQRLPSTDEELILDEMPADSSSPSTAPLTTSSPEPDGDDTGESRDAVDTPQEDIEFLHPGPQPPAAPPVSAASVPEHGWWRPLVAKPMRSSSQPLPISLEQLIASAVCYSDQLRVYSDAPLIRDMIVVEEDAEFDWVGFTEAMWNDISEPVGNTLTTGGPPRFQDEQAESRFGLRRRGTRGGRFEITQRFRHQNSNSIFFQPNNQGTSQLTLSYTQPLLRGAGRVYNSSLVVLAQIDANGARDEFSTLLQTYLLDVTNSYWSLFQQRAVLLQRERLFKRGQEILENLEHRSEIDALASQIIRARAAVAIRQSDLYRAATQVKNAESRIRALVNAPQLGLVDQFELLPVDAPGTQYIPVAMAEAMTLAIQNRPELHQAMKRIKAAAVRRNMSANELLPVLDIVLESYVQGLRGNSKVLESFGDSFSDGAPSYNIGVQMEMPLGNRAARATMRRREIELRQLESQFRATVDVLQLEVEVVVREIHTAFQEINAKYQAMKAAEHEVDYLTQRWKVLSGEDRSASLVLEDLLSAQDRLAAEELGFLEAQIGYNQSFTDLKQVTGSLLQLEAIDLNITPGPDGNPVLRPTKRQSYPTQQVAGYQVLSDQRASPIPSDASSVSSP